MHVERSNTLTTKAITTTSQLEELRPEWTRLFDKSQSTNPFARWEWTYDWWGEFGRSTGATRDELQILLHQDQHKQIQGITPLVKTVRRQRGIPISKLRNPGFVPGAFITEMPPYLWTPDNEIPVAQALTQYLHHKRHHYLWLELGGIPLDQPFGQILKSDLGDKGWLQPTPYFLLPVTEGWDGVFQRLEFVTKGRNYQREIARLLKRLEAGGHKCAFEIVDQPDRIQSALDDFFKLHKKRSEVVPKDPKFIHPDWFELPQTKQFLRNLGRDLTPNGLQVARMTVDGQAAATRVLYLASNHLFLNDSGYDPQWSEFAVMANLTTRIIRRACENPNIDVVNLSTNEDPSKLRWNPERRELGNLYRPSPALIYRSAARLRDKISSLF